MRFQVKRWEISKATPFFFYLFLYSDRRQESQEFQTKNSRAIPHDPQNPESSKSEGKSSNVGWSQQLREVLTATHVARLQFDSCAEKDSLCGTVMSHDGLNLTCLDQCHGVRSHGKSSSLAQKNCCTV